MIGLIFDISIETEVRDQLLPLLADHSAQAMPYRCSRLPDWPAGTTVLTCLDDDQLAGLIPQAVAREWSVGLLPHPGLIHARRCFGIAEPLELALEDALHGQAQSVDLLYGNQRPVFNALVVGKAFSLSNASDQIPGFRARLWHFVHILQSGFSALRLEPYTLTTGKDKSLATAALGIVMVKESSASLLFRQVVDDAGSNDGMLHALVLAPRSRMEMLRFLPEALFPGRSRKKLPRFMGHIKTTALNIASRGPLDYWSDGVWLSARQLELTIAPKALRLLPGRYRETREEAPQTREIYKVSGLPVGESRTALIGQRLPWLHRASTEDFRELYLALRDNARPSSVYLTLMVLSTLLATLGLFANSAPVIIGAMILAPLMGPIISLAMALVRQDRGLLTDSLRTLGLGLLLALSCGAVMAGIMPLHTVTGEIAARLNPTLLDLGVAVISGIAGAYAHAREEVARSLAGVAIAVALVPPLAVAGIGIGWGEWTVFRDSFLLFLTNLFGIVLAGNLTFLLLGFGPFRLARRGLLTALALVGVVSLPLGIGFTRMVEHNAIVRTLEGQEIAGVILREATVRPGDPVQVSVRLLSATTLDNPDVERVKQAIEARLGRPVRLEATLAIMR